jgi:hypothetical protein
VGAVKRVLLVSGLAVVAGGCTNDVPFFTDVPERKHPVAVIDPVLVAETGGAAVSFDSFVRYEASGEASHDADGEIVEWTWRVLTQPEGSGMSIEPIEEVQDLKRVHFRPDLVGAYGIELVVKDDDGLKSEPAVYEFAVAAASGLLLELTWDRDYTDVDLHLVHEQPSAAFYEAPWDCYFQNKNPDWGLPGVSGDDPLLPADIDDGYGPEIIGLREPPAGSYKIWSHYYCDDGFGGTSATVKVFLDGALVAEATTPLVHTGDLWEVASLTLDSNASPVLTVSSGGVSVVDRGCE